jgi:hypothetical protein
MASRSVFSRSIKIWNDLPLSLKEHEGSFQSLRAKFRETVIGSLC